MTTWCKVNCTFCSRKKYWSEIEHYVATLNLKISPLVTCARIVISLVHYPHSRNIFWNTQNEISYLHAALLYPLNISCVSFCFISEWGCPIKCECLPWWWTSMPCGPLLLSHTRQYSFPLLSFWIFLWSGCLPRSKARISCSGIKQILSQSCQMWQKVCLPRQVIY